MSTPIFPRLTNIHFLRFLIGSFCYLPLISSFLWFKIFLQFGTESVRSFFCIYLMSVKKKKKPYLYHECYTTHVPFHKISNHSSNRSGIPGSLSRRIPLWMAGLSEAVRRRCNDYKRQVIIAQINHFFTRGRYRGFMEEKHLDVETLRHRKL